MRSRSVTTTDLEERTCRPGSVLCTGKATVAVARAAESAAAARTTNDQRGRKYTNIRTEAMWTRAASAILIVNLFLCSGGALSLYVSSKTVAYGSSSTSSRRSQRGLT
jgi:hypothetical protein